MENALFKSFDLHLQRALDAEWHKVGAAARQLMTDVKTLRSLLDNLVNDNFIDCKSYFGVATRPYWKKDRKNETNQKIKPALTKTPHVYMRECDCVRVCEYAICIFFSFYTPIS